MNESVKKSLEMSKKKTHTFTIIAMNCVQKQLNRQTPTYVQTDALSTIKENQPPNSSQLISEQIISRLCFKVSYDD